MKPIKHHNEIMAPILQGSCLVLFSTIFNILYFTNESAELSFSFVTGLSSITLFTIINPIILYFHKQFKLYLYTSLIIFSLGLVHINYFAIGHYPKTLSIIPIDLDYTSSLLLVIYLCLLSISLLVKKLKIKRSDLNLPHLQLDNSQALS